MGFINWLNRYLGKTEAASNLQFDHFREDSNAKLELIRLEDRIVLSVTAGLGVTNTDVLEINLDANNDEATVSVIDNGATLQVDDGLGLPSSIMQFDPSQISSILVTGTDPSQTVQFLGQENLVLPGTIDLAGFTGDVNIGIDIQVDPSTPIQFSSESTVTYLGQFERMGDQLNILLPDELNSDDSFTIQINGQNLEIIDPDNTTPLLFSTPTAGLNSINVFGADGETDFLTLDYSSPGLADINITFDGGIGGNDALEFFGGTFDTITHDLTGPGAGSIDLSDDGITEISYTGLEPVFGGNNTANNIVINLPTLTTDAVLENSVIAGEMQIRSLSSAFELTTFASPSDSLTITMAGGNSVVTLNSFDAAFAPTNFIISGNTGDSYQLTGSDLLADTVSLTLSGGATLDLGAFNETVDGFLLEDGTVIATSGILSAQSDLDLRSGNVKAQLNGTNLIKNGAGTVILDALNGYTGTTTINDGILQLAQSNAIPNTSSVNLTAVTSVLDLNGFEVSLTSLTGPGTVQLGGASGLLDVNQTASTSSTFTGSINGDGSLTKSGAGDFTLSGTNSITGATDVKDGSFLVEGSLTTSEVIVASGAVLGGSGSIIAPVTVNSGGKIAPGSSPGILNTGNLTLSAGSTLDIEITGTTAGTEYDQIQVTGTVDITGATLNIISAFTAAAGNEFLLIDNDGSGDDVIGTFDGLAEGAFFTFNGNQVYITYMGGDGNDVVLIVNTPPSVSDQLFDADENTSNTTSIGTITASDTDLPPDALSFSVTGGSGQTAFDVSNSGEITVIDQTQLDFEMTNSFELEILVTDSAGATDTATITIDINPLNDNDPVVGNQIRNVDENSINGTNVGAVIVATDDDLPGDTLTFSETGGTGAAAFDITAAGQIVVADQSLLNFETNPSYTLDILVDDNAGRTTAATITINLNDLVETLIVDTGDWSVNDITLVRDGSQLRVLETGTLNEIVPSHNFANVSSVIITGNAENNTTRLDLSGGAIIPVNGIDFNGGTGTNTLVAPNQANDWEISGVNSGSLLSGSVVFSNVHNLTGNNSADTFVVQTGGQIEGIIDGGNGNDQLDVDTTAIVSALITSDGNGSGTVTGTSPITTYVTYNAIENFSVTGPADVQIVTTSNADIIEILVEGSTVEYRLGGTIIGTSSLTETNNITINGGDGDDSLTVDVALAAQGITVNYNGEGQDTPNPGDVLNLIGTSTSVEYFFTDANSGNIRIDGAPSDFIVYTGLEPITSTITTTDVTLIYSGVGETITITDAGGGQTTVNSTAGELLTFDNPTNSLTINSGAGDDTIDIDSLAANFTASLTIDGDGGNDTINANASLSFDTGKTIELNAETINVANAITLTAAGVALNGTEVNLDGDLVSANVSGESTTVNVLGSAGGADIQDAVDVAGNGGIINVAAGIYTTADTLEIDESVSLLGAGSDVVQIRKAGDPSNNFDVAVNISADSVTVSGAQLGWEIHTSATDYQGYVVLTRADNTTLNNLLFSDNYRSAVVFEGADNLEVSDSIFEGKFGRAAIRDGDSGSGENFLITRNEFRADHFRWGPIAIGPQGSSGSPNNFAFSGVISFNYFGNGLEAGSFQEAGDQNYTVTITNGGMTADGIDIVHNTFDWQDSATTNSNGVFAQPGGVFFDPSLSVPVGTVNITDNIFNGFTYDGPQPTTDPLWNPTGGQFGGALEFDGVDDFGVFQDPNFDVGESGTLSFWVNMDDQGERNQFFEGLNDLGMEFQFRPNDGGQFFGSPGRDGNSNNYVIQDGGAGGTEGNWQNIQYTWDYNGGVNPEMHIYIDGVEVAYLNSTFDSDLTQWMATVNTVNELITVGRDASGGRYFDGMMDDVGWFNEALDQTELDNIRNNGVAALALDSRLVAHWDFDQSTGDIAVDNKNGIQLFLSTNGIVPFGPEFQPTGGQFGGALEFDGIDDFATFQDPSFDVGESGTLNFWVLMEDTGRRNQFFEGPDNGGFEFQYRSNDGGQFFGRTQDGSDYTIQQGGNSDVEGVWTNVQYTWDASTGEMHIYLNGSEDPYLSSFDENLSGFDINHFTDTVNGLMNVGRDPGTGDRYFEGLMDDIGWFNEVLTPAERANIMSNGVAALSGDGRLVAHWDLDDAPGTTVVPGDSGTNIDLYIQAEPPLPPIEGFGVLAPLNANVTYNAFNDNDLDSNVTLDATNQFGDPLFAYESDPLFTPTDSLEEQFTIGFGSSAAYTSSEFASDTNTTTPHIGAFQNPPTLFPGIFGSGDIVVYGTGEDDLLVLTLTSENTATFELTRDVGGPNELVLDTVILTDITSITFNGLGGDDVLILNQPDNDFFNPTDGIVFNGGTQNNNGNTANPLNADGDTLIINHNVPTEADSVSYVFTPDAIPAEGEDGIITITDTAISDGSTTISFTGLEPILDNLVVADREFDFTDATETISFSDDSVAGDNYSFIDSDLSESVLFLNPTASITIKTDSVGSSAGIDTVQINSLDSSFNADLTIIAGADDSVTFQSALNLITGDLLVSAETVNIEANIEANSVDISSSGGTSTTVSSSAVVTTTGSQLYNDAVNFVTDSTFTSTGGDSIEFKSTIDGAVNLNINTAGNTILGGAVGSNTPLTSLTTNTLGTTAINGGSVTTTGAQTYNDAVTLGASTVFTSTTTGNLSFNSSVTGAVGFSVDITSQNAVNIIGSFMIDDSVAVTAGTDVQISSLLSSTTSSITILADNDINLSAAGRVLSDTNGQITLTADNDDSSAGSITMASGSTIESQGGLIELTADGTIAISSISTTGTVTIESKSAAITDNGDPLTDIIASIAVLKAVTGIGNGNPLETEIGMLTAMVSGSGNLFIDNTNAIELLDISTFDGSITINSTGTITATSVVSTNDSSNDNNDITLTTTGATSDIIVTTLTAQNTADVILTSARDILDSNSSDANQITGDQLTAIAVRNIGGITSIFTETGFDPLQTSVDHLDLTSGSGGASDTVIAIQNTDTSPELINLDAGSGSSGTTFIKATGGALDVALTSGISNIQDNIGFVSDTSITIPTGLQTSNLRLDAPDIIDIGGGNIVINAVNAILFNSASAETVEIAAQQFDGTATGSDFIITNNSPALELVDLDSDSVALTGGTDTNVSLTSTGSITVSNLVRTLGTGTLLIESTNTDADLIFNQNIESGTGSTTLLSANDIIFNGTSNLTSTSGSVMLTADFDSANSGIIDDFGEIKLADGTFINAGSGIVNLKATDDITISQIATTNATDLAIHLETQAAIIDAGDTNAHSLGAEDLIANAVGARVTIIAALGAGKVADSNKEIETNIDQVNITNLTSGEIQLIETDEIIIHDITQTTADNISVVAGGNIRLAGLIETGTGDVLLDSQASIIDQNDVVPSTVNIIAINVDLNAGTGIGVGNTLELSLETVSADTTTGDILLHNTATTSATATSLTTGSGNVELKQVGNESLNVDLASTSDGNITISNEGDAQTDTLTLTSVTAGGTTPEINVSTIGFGNILLGAVTALDGTINVTSAGEINDAVNDQASPVVDLNASSGSITLEAINGIGNSEPVELSAKTLSINTTTGNINVSNSSSDTTGAVTVSKVTTALGTIDYQQTGGQSTTFEEITTKDSAITILTDGSILFENPGLLTNVVSTDGTGTIQVTATGVNSSIEINDGFSTTGGTIDLTAEKNLNFGSAGDLSSSNGKLTLIADSGNRGSGGGGISMSDGTIFDSGTGIVDLKAGDDISIGQLITTTLARITSTAGGVADAGDTGGRDITAAEVAFRTSTGVGSANAIETAISTLAALNTDSGNVHILNDLGGALLTIGTVDGVNGVMHSGGIAGDIIIANASPLTVDSPVLNNSGGNIDLESTGAGDLTLNASVRASGGNGNINVDADAGILAINDTGVASDYSIEGTGVFSGHGDSGVIIESNTTLNSETGAIADIPPDLRNILTPQITATGDATVTGDFGRPTEQNFFITIDWGDGTVETFNFTEPGSFVLVHNYVANPNPGNPAADIPILITMQGDKQFTFSDGSGTLDFTSEAGLLETPGEGLATIAIDTTPQVPLLIFPQNEVILDSTSNQSSVFTSKDTQTIESAINEANKNAERLVFIRILAPNGETIKDEPLQESDLDNLPQLFQSLPDGRYQIYLKEAGEERIRLLMDVDIRGGKATDVTGEQVNPAPEASSQLESTKDKSTAQIETGNSALSSIGEIKNLISLITANIAPTDMGNNYGISENLRTLGQFEIQTPATQNIEATPNIQSNRPNVSTADDIELQNENLSLKESAWSSAALLSGYFHGRPALKQPAKQNEREAVMEKYGQRLMSRQYHISKRNQ